MRSLREAPFTSVTVILSVLWKRSCRRTKPFSPEMVNSVGVRERRLHAQDDTLPYVDHILAKPANLAELRNTLERLLQR